MFYKNLSYSEKTFYGVTFQPRAVAEVPGYINDLHMIVVHEAPKKQTVASSSANASRKKDDKKDIKKSGQNAESISNKTSIIQEETTDGSDHNQ